MRGEDAGTCSARDMRSSSEDGKFASDSPVSLMLCTRHKGKNNASLFTGPQEGYAPPGTLLCPWAALKVTVFLFLWRVCCAHAGGSTWGRCCTAARTRILPQSLSALCMQEGGVWINLGPLLYHWADAHTYLPGEEHSIELSLEDVERIAQRLGFELLQRRTIAAGFNTNARCGDCSALESDTKVLVCFGVLTQRSWGACKWCLVSLLSMVPSGLRTRFWQPHLNCSLKGYVPC